MDGKVGVIYSLQVGHLMCTRCVSVRRVCLKGSSRLKMPGETHSKIKSLSSESAVGMASARWIA